MSDELISARIKKLRTYLNLSVSDFASSVGYSEGYYRQVENGKFAPGRKLLDAVIECYGVNVDYLIRGEGEMLSCGPGVSCDSCEAGPVSGVGERVSEERKRQNFSLKDVAVMCGSTPETIRQIESGQHKVSERILRKVCDCLNVSYEWIMYGNVSSRDFPLNERMIEYLNKHPEKREIIVSWMNEDV